MKTLPLPSLCFSLVALLFAPTSAFADKSCAALEKAGELAAKQARIHNATDFMRSTAPAPNEKLSPLGEKMMQNVTIDKTNYMAMDGATFSTEIIKDDSERTLKSGIVIFSMVDEGCRSLGKATVAGRTANVYEAGSNKTSNDRYFKFWIDAQTGLPLKGIEDAPLPEVKSFGASKAGKPKIEVEMNKVKRVINTTAFVFGDVVKAPKLGGAKNLFGQKGELDAAAVAMLKAIVTGP